MSSSPGRACIRWPQSTCELVTGSLSRLLELDHLVEAVSASFSAQVLFRDSAVRSEKLDPVRNFFADRAPLHEFEIPGGEACKSPESWFRLLGNLAQVKLDRGGLVIVAGGGAHRVELESLVDVVTEAATHGREKRPCVAHLRSVRPCDVVPKGTPQPRFRVRRNHRLDQPTIEGGDEGAEHVQFTSGPLDDGESTPIDLRAKELTPRSEDVKRAGARLTSRL